MQSLWHASFTLIVSLVLFSSFKYKTKQNTQQKTETKNPSMSADIFRLDVNSPYVKTKCSMFGVSLYRSHPLWGRLCWEMDFGKLPSEHRSAPWLGIAWKSCLQSFEMPKNSQSWRQIDVTCFGDKANCLIGFYPLDQLVVLGCDKAHWNFSEGKPNVVKQLWSCTRKSGKWDTPLNFLFMNTQACRTFKPPTLPFATHSYFQNPRVFMYFQTVYPLLKAHFSDVCEDQRDKLATNLHPTQSLVVHGRDHS